MGWNGDIMSAPMAMGTRLAGTPPGRSLSSSLKPANSLGTDSSSAFKSSSSMSSASTSESAVLLLLRMAGLLPLSAGRTSALSTASST